MWEATHVKCSDSAWQWINKTGKSLSKALLSISGGSCLHHLAQVHKVEVAFHLNGRNHSHFSEFWSHHRRGRDSAGEGPRLYSSNLAEMGREGLGQGNPLPSTQSAFISRRPVLIGVK